MPRGNNPRFVPFLSASRCLRDAPRHAREASSLLVSQFAPLAFSSLHTLFLAPKLQPSPFHAFRDSFTNREKITPAFPITSPLFARSLAKERKSTPLFSCIPALFCEKWGCPLKEKRNRSARGPRHRPAGPAR